MIRFSNISKRMMQYSIMLMLFLVQSVAASAQARLYMENFSIGNDETVEVALLLDNDQAATALQAKITLPNGLQYVDGSVAKTDRVKGRAAEVQASTATGQLVIVETDGTIAAGEGAVITFQVQRNGGNDRVYNMIISDIVVSDANANQLNEVETQRVRVSFVGLRDCKFAAPEAINMTVGQEYQVDVTLKNDGVNNLSAFQGKLALPKGLEIVPGEDGKFIYSDRIPAKAEFKFQEYEGYTQFVLSSSSNYIINGTEGVIFSFKVKATEDLAENTEITLTDLRVAATTGQSGLSPDVTISVTNTSVSDKAAFEAYQTDQAAAVVAMAAEGDSEASQQLITDAKAAIEALIFDYAKSLDENKALVDAIVEKLTTDLAAQRAEDAEAAAVAAANAKLADLKTAAEALKVSDEAMAIDNALVNAAVTAAEQAIADANTAIGAVETVIAEGKLATENKEKLATAIAASEQAIADAQTAIATVDETYAGVLAADKLAEEKTAAEALKVSDEAKAYDNETVKAAVATAEQAIADANTAIAAVEAVIAEGNLATENKEKLATAIAAADKAIADAQTAVAAAEKAYTDQKAADEEDAAVKAANEKLAQEKTAAEALKVSDEAKAYDNETVKAAVATAEQAIADANTAIAAVEAVIAEGNLATENKEKLATAIAAADKGIVDAQTAIATAEEVYNTVKAGDEEAAAVKAANEKLAQEKTAAEALKVSDEAKAYDNETVKAAVATAEQAIADANTAIAAVEAVIAVGKLATENKEKLATAIAAADKAIVGAQTAIATAEEVYNTVKAGDEEAAAVKAANEKLAQEKTAAEALKVSDEAKAYDNETVKAAVATAEQAIADANTAIGAVEAVIAEGNLATENKEKLATAIAAADKAIADAQTAVATAEQVYAEQKAAEPIPGDITGTGSVDTEDLMQFQDDFLNGDIPSKDDPKYAVYDVNGDGKVNVADLQAILNISLGLNIDGTVPGSALSRTFRMDTFEAGTMNVKAIKLSNGNTQLAIELNSNADYRALQMEVVLTGNVNIVGENAEGMALRSKNLNNIYRVIGYGQLESNGTMLTLEAAGDGTVSFNNVVLATPEAEAVEFNLCGTNGTELSLGDTTGINTIAVEAYEGNTIYDLGGKRMNGIKKGINIIRDQNGEIKKVLK